MDEVGSSLNLDNSQPITEQSKARLNEVIKKKNKRLKEEDYEKAANLRYEEIQLRKQLEKAETKEKAK